MKRDLLEKITITLVVNLILVFAAGTILMFANAFFEWDLFPPFTEKLFYFLASAIFVIIMSCAAINMMLNISRIAFFLEKIALKQIKK